MVTVGLLEEQFTVAGLVNNSAHILQDVSQNGIGMFGQDVDQRDSTGGELTVVDVFHIGEPICQEADAALEHFVRGREAEGHRLRIGWRMHFRRRHFQEGGARQMRQSVVFGPPFAQTDGNEDVHVAADDLNLKQHNGRVTFRHPVSTSSNLRLTDRKRVSESKLANHQRIIITELPSNCVFIKY